MVKRGRCLRMWYLSMGRINECRSREWRLIVWRLREGSLKLNTLSLWGSLCLEWRNVKLRPSLLMATLRVYSILHFLYLDLLLNSGMCLSLSLGLYWCSLYSPYIRTIRGLLKFHPHHRLIIIHIISVEGLKICLFDQINVDILEHSSEEVTIREYVSRALAIWDHVHHHQVPKVDSSPSQNRVNKECLIIRDLISVSTPW